MSLVIVALNISAVKVWVLRSGCPKTISANASTGSPLEPVGMPRSINLS